MVHRFLSATIRYVDGKGVANGGTEAPGSTSGPLRFKLPSMSSLHRSTPSTDGYNNDVDRASFPRSPGPTSPTTSELSLRFRLPTFRVPAPPPRNDGGTMIRLKMPKSSGPHYATASSSEDEGGDEGDSPDSSLKAGPLKVRLKKSEGGGGYSYGSTSGTSAGSLVKKQKPGSTGKPKPTYACEYCGKSFGWPWSVKRHQKDSCVRIPEEDRKTVMTGRKDDDSMSYW